MMNMENKEDLHKLTEQLIMAVLRLTPQKKQKLAALLEQWNTPSTTSPSLPIAPVDSREDERVYCFFPVDYSSKNRLYQDFINNLSTGGVFIETAATLNVGQTLSMIFNMPLLPQSFKISGQIVRTDRDGVGVKFDKKLTSYQKDLVSRSGQQ